MRKTIIGGVVFGLAFAQLGWAAEKCVAQSLVSGAVQGRMMSDQGCVAEVGPADNATLVYREYYFFDDGLMMIFNSVDGSDAKATGARAYYLFPRHTLPQVQKLSSGQIAARSASGAMFYFSPRTARLDSADGVRFTEDPNVSMGNNGGLEITQYDGVLLDAGWMIGDLAFSDSRRSSVFRDAKGASCDVANAEIFDYTSGPAFRFATDAALATFLKQRCPGLDTGVLQ